MLRSWRATEVEASGQILLCHWSKMPCLSSEGPHGHSMGTRKSHPSLEFKPVFKQHQATWSAGLLNTESVQLLSHVWLFVTPWTAAHQASLSFTISWNLLKLMSILLVMPSNHLILCHLLLLPPSIFPGIRVFSNESVLHINGQSIGVSASSSVLPMNIQDWSPLGWTGWISLQSKGLSRVFSKTFEPQFKSIDSSDSAFFVVQFSHPYMTTGKTITFTKQTFVSIVSPFNMLSRLMIAFIARSKYL